MKRIILLSFFLTISCVEKKPSETLMTKKESILTQQKIIEIKNDTGKVNVTVGEKVSLEYEKKDWREWCLLHHKEEGDKIIIETENTSFTGENGCELNWNLQLTKDSILKLTQKAGKIEGLGAIESLDVTMAAGSLDWTNGNMPLIVKISAGSINLQDMLWSNEGKSSITLSTGNVEITSPKEAQVTTKVLTNVGMSKNDFNVEGKKHLLEINVAVGKVSHTF
ncbi:MAG: hypothetical protein K9K67_09215 [Bacteriovoracaceae bacterium]|nr:hypothetical protein [Bacteriovoracaceae bacterium]